VLSKRAVGYGAYRPGVSIILCTFNRARLIKRAISSVFNQTCSSWELIVVDDGSVDETAEIVLALARRDRRLTYIRHPNQGLAASRNVGLSLATGKYVGFLDSDDELKPKHIERRLSYLESHPAVGAVHGGLTCVGPRSKQYVADVTAPGKKIHVSKCFVAGTILARRSALTRVGGFRDVPFGDDFDLVRRLRRKQTVRRVRWPTYVYRTDAPDRLCDLYEEGGAGAILRFRRMGLDRTVSGRDP
jgi:glycosyltransferase involved in cell wall biosynthesis